MNDSFKNPSPEYRGTELFMLNDKLEGAELERQVKEMKEQGFYSFIARTYIGLKSDYPGADFHERTGDIIRACKKYDMKVFLQAGYMPGGVPDLPAQFTHKGLRPVAAGENPERRLKTILSKNNVDYSVMEEKYFLDMLDKDAVNYYVKKSYEEMWSCFKDEFGKTVISVWVDEPHFCPPDLPWTDKFAEVFESLWHYDITKKVNLLFEKDEGWQSVRYHYWRTVLRLLQDGYFKGISSWCKKNNLMFSGHLMGEDTLYHQISQTCDCMPLYKYFDIPGIDFLTADLDWKHGTHKGLKDNYLFVNTPLQCVSAANQAGQKQVLCEMFGVSKQNLTFEDQKYLFDFFAGFGVNHKMVHGVFYSLKGRAKRSYPPHVNYYQPYWSDYGLLNDCFARKSWFISQGKPVADMLVIHPVETAFSDYENDKRKGLDKRDRAFNELLQRLLAVHVPFELGDEETIAEWGSTVDGCFVVGKMSYKTVALPNLDVIRESTLKLLEQFAAQGGTVILVGKAPGFLDGNSFDTARIKNIKGLVTVERDTDLAEWIAEREDKPFDVECSGDGSSVFVNARKTENGYHLFVFNMDRDSKKDVKISLPGDFGCRCFHAESGEQTLWPVENGNGKNTGVCFTLEKGGSIMLGLSKNEKPLAAQADTVRSVFSVAGGFTAKRKNQNVLVVEMARFKRGNGAWEGPYPVLAIHNLLKKENYVGEVTLAFTIRSAAALSGASLALEDSALTKIELNGIALDSAQNGYYWAKAFETVSLPALRKGENILTLTRNFKSPAKPLINYSALFQNLGGVELESVYLLGDFFVQSVPEKTSTGCVRLSPNFTLCEKGESCATDLVSSGLPFYAGSVELEKTFTLKEAPAGKALLYLEDFHGCTAKVTVNGKSAGLIAWQPYAVDVSGLFTAGENRVTITITNTLRNLLGPYHRPVGEPGHCWGNYSSPDGPWMGDYEFNAAEAVSVAWYEERRPDTAQWTDSYLQMPFGLRGFRVEYS